MIARLGRLIALGYSAPREAARQILDSGSAARQAVTLILLGVLLNLGAEKLAEIIAGRNLLIAAVENVPGLREAIAESLQAEGLEGVTVDAVLASTPMKVGYTVANGVRLLFSYMLLGAAAFWAARMFQGRAGFRETLAMTGLWAVTVTPAFFVAMLARVAAPESLVQPAHWFALGIEFVLIYQLAAYLAEAHGFPSAGRVLMAIVGAYVLLQLFFVALSGGGGAA